jgi:CRP/FNR family transcriptional regulator
MSDLSRIGIFSTLKDRDLKEIAPYFIPESFKKKETVFSEGDPPDWFYIVREGKVKITKLSHEGREIILEIISPDDFFGGIAVIKGFPYPANAVAMEDTKLLKVSRGDLMRILDRFPSVMYCIAQNMGDRIKGSHETLKNIALERIEARIASLLIKLADKTGEKTPSGILIDIRLTRQDIAEMVGTTVETSIRTMSKFKKLGIVSEKAGKILVKDAERLKSLRGV